MKQYMKKIGAVILCASLLMSGCGNTTMISSNSDSDSPAGKSSSPAGGNVADSDEITFVSDDYKYNHELNIIEDNYRNFYEIFLYSYADSDGNGIGDINGLIDKLDYINDGDDTTDTDLGFNGIWLMPVMPSTTYHKYDVIDYKDIDEEYGTLDDFKRLVDECHKRKIHLIIDLVMNHTSSQHEWFVKATDYLKTLKDGEKPDKKKCKYLDYYYFVEGDPGKSTYYQVGDTNWYYEAVFWEHMPDLNLANQSVRKEMESIASFWLDLGVDGFRLDAAKEYYSGSSEKNVKVLNWFCDYVKSQKEDAYVVAEVWDSFSSMANYYESGVDSCFNFALSQSDGKIATTLNSTSTTNKAKSFAEAMVKIQDTLSAKNPDYIDAPFLVNHDTTRASAVFAKNEDKMKMAAGMTLMMSGSPFIYYGEEIGMSSMGTKDENKRTPMYWSAQDSSFMTKGPKDADVFENSFPALDEQQMDSDSIYYYYKRAVRIKNENPEIARGTVEVNETLSGDAVCVIKKTYKESSVTLVYNISEQNQEVDLSSCTGDNGALELYGYLSVDQDEPSYSEDGVLSMPKYSIVVLR
ncbi:MAG: alpha-amylase family glycosyl hydrolase [Clostridiales bacterium]|nr:alpha-amylase family glycosyl hydrolase [Clostridiales bacterium]